MNSCISYLFLPLQQLESYMEQSKLTDTLDSE
jgi:hypothetical protein